MERFEFCKMDWDTDCPLGLSGWPVPLIYVCHEIRETGTHTQLLYVICYFHMTEPSPPSTGTGVTWQSSHRHITKASDSLGWIFCSATQTQQTICPVPVDRTIEQTVNLATPKTSGGIVAISLSLVANQRLDSDRQITTGPRALWICREMAGKNKKHKETSFLSSEKMMSESHGHCRELGQPVRDKRHKWAMHQHHIWSEDYWQYSRGLADCR